MEMLTWIKMEQKPRTGNTKERKRRSLFPLQLALLLCQHTSCPKGLQGFGAADRGVYSGLSFPSGPRESEVVNVGTRRAPHLSEFSDPTGLAEKEVFCSPSVCSCTFLNLFILECIFLNLCTKMSSFDLDPWKMLGLDSAEYSKNLTTVV